MGWAELGMVCPGNGIAWIVADLGMGCPGMGWPAMGWAEHGLVWSWSVRDIGWAGHAPVSAWNSLFTGWAGHGLPRFAHGVG